MSSFVFSRPDGTQRTVSGYRYRAPLASAKRYAAQASGVGNLPPKVDLRPQMTAVEDQGRLSSCVANAVAGAYEYLVKKHRGDDAYDVSRLFIYYNARAKDGEPSGDDGSFISDAFESLRQKGACSEKTWPYDPERVNEQPSDEAYEEAANFLVEDIQLVPTTLDDWRHALAEGSPIAFGISLFDSFDKHKKRGFVPMPTKNESSRASHGGHAMLCVGYSDPDRVFIVRNSWGTTWGDAGYCFIPYDYLMNSKYNDGDSWMIRQLGNVEVDKGTWGDDESLIGDLDTELAQMSDEDYQDMIDAMGGIHLETRLAIIFLRAASADGDLAEDEFHGIVGYVQTMLEELGSAYDAEKILREAKKKMSNERVLAESIELFAAHVPQTMLASILKSLREIVGVDDVAEEEDEFLAMLIEAWQVDPAGDNDDGEEPEEDEEEEDEDEDDEEEDGEDEDAEEEDAEEEDGEEEDGEEDDEDEDEDEDEEEEEPEEDE